MNVTAVVDLGLWHRHATVEAIRRIVQACAVALLSWMSAQCAAARELLMANATVRAT